jgi:hypothetical protein
MLEARRGEARRGAARTQEPATGLLSVRRDPGLCRRLTQTDPEASDRDCGGLTAGPAGSLQPGRRERGAIRGAKRCRTVSLQCLRGRPARLLLLVDALCVVVSPPYTRAVAGSNPAAPAAAPTGLAEPLAGRLRRLV